MTVERDELEDALRATLSRPVVPPPVAPDRAGIAIQQGRRAQRRRTSLGMTLVALATAVISLGLVHVGASREAPLMGDPFDVPYPSAGPSLPTTAPAAPPAVDLVAGEVLLAADGARVRLPARAPVTAARRVPGGGWLLVSTATAGHPDLWYVPRATPPTRLLTRVDAVVVAADGQRVAWRQGDRLSVGTLIDGALDVGTTATVPLDTQPVGFVGVGVLLRGGPTGAGGHDVWWASTPQQSPAWNTSVLAVHGHLPDGHTAVGQVATPGAAPCLALLEAWRHLAPVRTLCGVSIDVNAPAAVSPDGRWLVGNAPGRPGATSSAVVVDLEAARTSSPVARPLGPPLTAGFRWTGPATLVYLGARGELLRVAVDRGQVDRFPVAGVPRGVRPVLVTGD